MTPILLDTSCYIAFLRGDPQVADLLRKAPKILIPTITLGELMTGFYLLDGLDKHDEPKQLSSTSEIAHLHKFMDTPRVHLVEVTYRTSEHMGFIAAELKHAGTPIPTNDLWIAALAKEHGCPVATLDNHFRVVPGLQVVP
ncbi:MAG: type II toxin-antitoxin system VapC family toxin [Balneolaceae bacterium]|nr:type II toxin-antitoxin system VapC family toxin [Balneolaceae bacterium]MDR9447274.1 type II toxin-antitoxin system VapC family toxin [Balneolaceae bacterium]